MNRLYRETPITLLLRRWLLNPLFLFARQAVAGSPMNPAGQEQTAPWFLALHCAP